MLPSVSDVCRVIELLDRLQRSGELPPPKLQALQRVLQSKFCAAIREVLYSRTEVWGRSGCAWVCQTEATDIRFVKKLQ